MPAEYHAHLSVPKLASNWEMRRIAHKNLTSDQLEKWARSGIALSFADEHQNTDPISLPGLVSIFSHSNGSDLFLGSRTLCSRPDRKAPGHALTCVDSGLCHRHSIQLDDPSLNKLLVPTRAVAGRIVLLGACFGLPLPNRTKWQDTLIADLISTPGVVAVIATWKTFLAPKHCLEALHEELAQGKPCGTAVMQFNELREVQATGSFLCVIGDPHATAPIGSEIQLYDYLSDRSSLPTPQEGSFTRQFGELVRQCEGPVGIQGVVAHISSIGTQIFRDWCRSTTELVHRRSAICACGERGAETLGFRLDWGRSPRFRFVTLCPICGFVEDMPVLGSTQTHISKSGFDLIIRWEKVRTGFCGVRLESQAAVPMHIETTCVQDGYAKVHLAIPEGCGPIFAATFHVDESDISLRTWKVR